MKKISNRKEKKFKKYIYTMSLIFISIKKFFQLHLALGEVPTCFKKKKQNWVKNQPKEKMIKKRRRRIWFVIPLLLFKIFWASAILPRRVMVRVKILKKKKRPIGEKGSKTMRPRECKSVSVSLQQKMFITTKKIVTITSKSLQ